MLQKMVVSDEEKAKLEVADSSIPSNYKERREEKGDDEGIHPSRTIQIKGCHSFS
jgi:hypothetical protein